MAQVVNPPVLRILPDNREPITFSSTGIADGGSQGWYFQIGTLDLSEEERKQIVYSDKRRTSVNYNLVPITFEVLIWGTTRDNMIEAAQRLELAVCNVDGGYFEYRPEDATGLHTFYRYEQSPIPTVRKSKINHWDTIPETEGNHVIMLQVELQTHPVGISDPESPVFIQLDTFGDTGILSSEISPDKIQGDQPAFLIYDVNNPLGTTKTLNRIYVFSRSGYLSSGLNNFDPFKLAEDGTTNAGPWTTPTTSERYGTTVQRLTPTGLDMGDWLELDLMNLDLHYGRISVFAAVKPSDDPNNWRIRTRFDIGAATIINNSDRFSPEHQNKYHWMYCGDIDISNILIPDTINTPNGLLRLTVDRIAGGLTEHIDIDAVFLIYQDESAMQVNVATDQASGFGAEETIKLDYMFDKGQRTVLHLDNVGGLLGFAQAVFGSPAIQANPKFSTVVAFVGEGTTGSSHMASSYVQFNTYCSAIFRTIYPFGG